MINHHAPTCLISLMRSTDIIINNKHKYKGKEKHNQSKEKDNGDNDVDLWMVIGYHPSTRRCLQSAVSRFNSDPAMRWLWSCTGSKNQAPNTYCMGKPIATSHRNCQ